MHQQSITEDAAEPAHCIGGIPHSRIGCIQNDPGTEISHSDDLHTIIPSEYSNFFGQQRFWYD